MTVANTANTIVRESTLTCPHCGHQSLETMPDDACVVLHECPGCGTAMRPQPGDCCVFCSYGTVPCPPVQRAKRCCA